MPDEDIQNTSPEVFHKSHGPIHSGKRENTPCGPISDFPKALEKHPLGNGKEKGTSGSFAMVASGMTR
jgi:hypothetical protein